MKKTWPLYLVFLAVMFTISCTAGPNSAVHTADSNGNIAGFWLGLWHGVIVGFAFIASLFSNNVHIYEVHNNGGWYNLGFIMGIGSFSNLTRLFTGRSK